MLTKFKKSFTIALAVVMCVSSVCASAASWRVKDYDTNIIYDAGAVPAVEIIYEEVDDAGRFTGRMARAFVNEGKNQPNAGAFGAYPLDGYPYYSTTYVSSIEEGLRPFANVELKNKWVDIYYPNCEYAGVYADGYYLGKNVATQLFGKAAGVQYKDVDYMWELVAPFGIYSVTKAKLNINGAAQWFGTPEYGYPTQYTGRNASVEVKFSDYGFGTYHKVGDNKVELVTEKMRGFFDEENLLTATALMVEPVKAAPTKSIIAYRDDIKIPRSYDYTLVGPAFDAEGNAIPAAKTVRSSEYLGDLNNFGCKKLITSVKDRAGVPTYCEITWTDGGYELESPHNIYKWLTVDGVVMDGSYIGNYAGQDYWRPAIAVYTGAVANIY